LGCGSCPWVGTTESRKLLRPIPLQAVEQLAADVQSNAARKSASTGVGYLPAAVPVR
jgi:hypothetical protein